jgi:hypothetical protein
MKTEHPITPPPELVQQWWDGTHGALYEFEAVATQAARWGADQELDACCQEVHDWYGNGSRLRAARRPKPPSLKEQALDELQLSFGRGYLKKEGADTIRRALDSLPD